MQPLARRRNGSYLLKYRSPFYCSSYPIAWFVFRTSNQASRKTRFTVQHRKTMVQRRSLLVQRVFGLLGGAKANFYRGPSVDTCSVKGAGAQQSIRRGPYVAWDDAMLEATT